MNHVYELTDKGAERNVSYLPLSHIAASMMDIYVMMACQGTTYFADKSALKGTLTITLQEALPTLFLGVPRVWEKIQEKMMQVGAANKGLKRQIGQWAKRTGLVWNHNRLNGMEASMTSGLKYKIADKVVFQVKSKLSRKNGSNFFFFCRKSKPLWDSTNVRVFSLLRHPSPWTLWTIS